MSESTEFPMILLEKLIELSDVRSKDLTGQNPFQSLCGDALLSSAKTYRLTAIEMFLKYDPKLARIPDEDSNMYPLHLYFAQGDLAFLQLPTPDEVMRGYRAIIDANPKVLSRQCESGMIPTTIYVDILYQCSHQILNLMKSH